MQMTSMKFNCYTKGADSRNNTAAAVGSINIMLSRSSCIGEEFSQAETGRPPVSHQIQGYPP